MRSVSSILVREGPTDDAFFGTLLRRMLEDVTALYASWPVHVDDPITIYPDAGNSSFADRVASAIEKWRLRPQLCFYHTDAGGDVPAAYSERVEPVAQAIGKVCPDSITIG